MVDESDAAAASCFEAERRGSGAVVSVLEITKVFFIEKADTVQHRALQVDAGKNDTLHIAAIVKLVNVLFAGSGLLAPKRFEGHVRARVLQYAIGPNETASHRSNTFLLIR